MLEAVKYVVFLRLVACLFIAGPCALYGETESALEEVLVTATKQGAVDIQSIPIAITSISGDELKLSNITNIKDLALLAPGIMVSQNTN